jgi:hypothetical protein
MMSITGFIPYVCPGLTELPLQSCFRVNPTREIRFVDLQTDFLNYILFPVAFESLLT